MGPIRYEMKPPPAPAPYPPPHPKFNSKPKFSPSKFSPLPPKSEFNPLPYPLRTRSLEELRKVKPTTISFKTVPLSKSLQDLVNMPTKPLSPKVTQAWLDIGKNYASLSPEPQDNAEETPTTATEETATPSIITWTTSSRTQTATATTPAQKVRINYILITIRS